MSNRTRRTAGSLRAPGLLEALESRLLLSSAPSGITPAQIRHAYGFDRVQGDGSGQTIAIVTAYDAPTIAADLDIFDQTFSLDGTQTLYARYGAASAILTKHAMNSTMKPDAGWAQETALDVEWAHAIAPGARILLVEAGSANVTDMMSAVRYARSQGSVSVVSMSWGGNESYAQTQFDSLFTTPAGHKGITFVAAAGDQGGVATYPASSRNVLAVGGTSLSLVGSGYAGESAWSDSGGGVSGVEIAGAWQSAITGMKLRGSPDVAYDADPSSGFSVYDSFANRGQSGWLVFGGTSAGTPQWSGLIAIADQLRVQSGRGTLDGVSQTLPALYAAPAGNFHDIVAGSSGMYSATPGYDLITGLGSPVANRLIPTLAQANTSSKRRTTPTPTTSPTRTRFPNRTRFRLALAEQVAPATADGALSAPAPDFAIIPQLPEALSPAPLPQFTAIPLPAPATTTTAPLYTTRTADAPLLAAERDPLLPMLG